MASFALPLFFFSKLTRRSQKRNVLWEPYHTFPRMSRRLRITQAFLCWSIFCPLMSKASLTNNWETYPKPGLSLMFSYLPGLELGKTKPALPRGEFTFYRIPSASIFLLCIFRSLVPRIHLLYSALTVFQVGSRKRGGKPALLEMNETKDMMFFFMINVHFSTNRQVLHFKWLDWVVLWYIEFPTDRV